MQRESRHWRAISLTIMIVLVAQMIVISSTFASTYNRNDVLGYNFPDDGINLSQIESVVQEMRSFPASDVILMDSQVYNNTRICISGSQGCLASGQWNYFFQYAQFESGHKVIDFTNDTGTLRSELAGFSTITIVFLPLNATWIHYPWLRNTMEALSSSFRLVNQTYSYNATTPQESYTTPQLNYLGESDVRLEVRNYNNSSVYFNVFSSQDGTNYENIFGPAPFDGSQNQDLGANSAAMNYTIPSGRFPPTQFLRFGTFDCTCSTPAPAKFFVSIQLDTNEIVTPYPHRYEYFGQIAEIDVPVSDFVASLTR